MDTGRRLTDKELEQVEKRIAKEYKQAEKEMRKKLKKQTADFGVKDKAKAELLKQGKLSESDYLNWREAQLKRSAWMKNLIDDYVSEQVKANKRASAIINGSLADVYAENRNFATYEIEKELAVDTSFKLYSKKSVRDLQIGTQINVAKDRAWHNRKIQSALTQGIVQGESIDKISERLLRIGIMDENAAMRNARTMVGAAESKARLDSYLEASEKGIKMKKTWIATLDDRVRDSHAELDGETVELNEKFSNGLMYPRDPNGDPAEVYNCRCDMIAQIAGFERDVTDLDIRPAKIGSYEEWKTAHTKATLKRRLRQAIKRVLDKYYKR